VLILSEEIRIAHRFNKEKGTAEETFAKRHPFVSLRTPKIYKPDTSKWLNKYRFLHAFAWAHEECVGVEQGVLYDNRDMCQNV
jgi:hypothetical protein